MPDTHKEPPACCSFPSVLLLVLTPLLEKACVPLLVLFIEKLEVEGDVCLQVSQMKVLRSGEAVWPT